MSDTEELVKVLGSDVFFHCDVTDDSTLELITKLMKLELELLHKYLSLGIRHRPEIRIFIKSDGGDMHAGLSAMDFIQSMKRVKVSTIAQGLCASAATFILLAGRRRYMMENAYIMIHQINVEEASGKFEDLKDHTRGLKQFMARFRDIYLDETRIPASELKKLLKRDLHLDSDMCMDWAIVDDIWS